MIVLLDVRDLLEQLNDAFAAEKARVYRVGGKVCVDLATVDFDSSDVEHSIDDVLSADKRMTTELHVKRENLFLLLSFSG